MQTLSICELNLLAGWFHQSRLPRASWWLAPSSATAGGPKPRPDRPALWLTGLPHSLIGPLARGTCCPEALMEVRLFLGPHGGSLKFPGLCCEAITWLQPVRFRKWTDGWQCMYKTCFSSLTQCKYFSTRVYWVCVMALKGVRTKSLRVPCCQCLKFLGKNRIEGSF